MAQDVDMRGLEAALIAEIGAASDLRALEDVRIAALGRKGRVGELMGRLGALTPEERKGFGQAINGLKQRVSEALEARKQELDRVLLRARLASERVDITLPVRAGAMAEGRIHPVSQVFDEVAEIFADMGFAIAEGPDIESDDFNFGKLNIPPEHPAPGPARTTTPSISMPGPTARGCCCAPIPARCRSAPCWRRSRRSASSCRAASIASTAMRRTRRCSIRSRGW